MGGPELAKKPEILSETDGAVGLITLNRPEALNALNHPLMKQLVAALEAFEKDPAVHAIVIAGSERAFAAGADIKEMDQATSKEMAADPHLSNWDRVGKCSKPTIAAVSGFALGGGCELAMACDMIVASESATFGQPEILIGVIPGAGGTQRLTRAVGRARAMELTLTGRRFSAREAMQWGLVNRVVPVESFLHEAKKLAREIASKPPLAVKAARQAINEALDADLESGLQLERKLFWKLFDTQDQKEGMKAFIEKREAKFVGK